MATGRSVYAAVRRGIWETSWAATTANGLGRACSRLRGWCCGVRVFVVLLINHQLLKIRYAILARVLDPCSPLMRLDLNAGCRAVGP
jgi:hypothetical protein